MKKRPVFAGLLIIVMILVAGALEPSRVIEAKGPPNAITISGPGLLGVVEIDDAELLQNLGFAGLEDLDNMLDAPPEVVGPGFHIYRLGMDMTNGGALEPYEELMYYPDAAGGTGYVHYLGILNGTMQYDDHWFVPHTQSEQDLLRLLMDQGAQLVHVSQESEDLPIGCKVANVATMLVDFVDAYNEGDEARLAGYLGEQLDHFSLTAFQDDSSQLRFESTEDVLSDLMGRYANEYWQIHEVNVHPSVWRGRVDFEFTLSAYSSPLFDTTQKNGIRVVTWGQGAYLCETGTFFSWDMALNDDSKLLQMTDFAGAVCPRTPTEVRVMACVRDISK